MGNGGVYEFIHFFLRIVLDFYRLICKETEPNFADVPHELVLSI